MPTARVKRQLLLECAGCGKRNVNPVAHDMTICERCYRYITLHDMVRSLMREIHFIESQLAQEGLRTPDFEQDQKQSIQAYRTNPPLAIQRTLALFEQPETE